MTHLEMTIDKTRPPYTTGYECGQRGGKTDKGFPQYNPFGHHGVNWHIWNDAFADGAREAGHRIATDHDGRNFIPPAAAPLTP